AERDEPLLELASLKAGADQDGDVVELVAGALQRLDLVGDDARLLLAVPEAAQRDLLAAVAGRPQRFAEPAAIARDQARRRAQDVAGRAVVLLEPNNARAGEVLLELEDVADLGAAPAVDRLVVVADAAYVAPSLRQQAQPQI